MDKPKVHFQFYEHLLLRQEYVREVEAPRIGEYVNFYGKYRGQVTDVRHEFKIDEGVYEEYSIIVCVKADPRFL